MFCLPMAGASPVMGFLFLLFFDYKNDTLFTYTYKKQGGFMRVLLLIGLLLFPSIDCKSAPKKDEHAYELQIQKEDDELKVKIASIVAVVVIVMLWARGSGDDAKSFDQMIRDILKK